MKRYVSAWNMRKARSAFTLIEVMVAVMIISVVIMALLQMQGNTSHIFSKLGNTLKINQYTSLFISNKDYGFEKKSVDLDDLLSEFKVENELRRELKTIKVKVDYEELKTIDMSENEEGSSSLVFELGKTVLKIDDSSSSILRFKIQ